MKKFIFVILALGMIFVSCKKDELPTPTQTTANADTTNWEDEYNNGGLLPTNTNTNALEGTKWELIKYITGNLATQYVHDTLVFLPNYRYTLNGGASRVYQLSSITGSTNKQLTLDFFTSFGGSNYAGVVGAYFVEDGFINNAEFTDMQNSSIKIKAWFKKL